MKKILLIAIALSLVSVSVIFLVKALTSYSVDPGQTVTISEHGVTKTITNNNAKKMFIPTKTAAEWQSFVDHAQNVTVADPTVYVDDVFSTYLYTGNGSTQTINNGIDLAGNGGMVWIKNRGSALSNYLTDSARGATQALSSNTTAAQTAGAADMSYQSTGFSLLQSGTNSNGTSNTYASWTFRESPKFFDIVTYTGDGTSNRQIAHNLGIEPGMIIVKSLSAGEWSVYHRVIGATGRLQLNSTVNTQISSAYWNNTEPTNSFFTLGSQAAINGNGQTYVAYLYAHDPAPDGKIQCGSYEGTGTGTGGNKVTLGWEPQYLLVKNADASANWILFDTMRGVARAGSAKEIRPNTSDVEANADASWELDPDGFRVINTNAVNSNALNNTYIYCTIRRPNKPPVSSAGVYKAIARTGTSAVATVTGVGFTPDMVIGKPLNAVNPSAWYDRLRGVLKSVQSSNTTAEGTYTDSVTVFNMNGISIGADLTEYSFNYNTKSLINHFFRRAPGFFDIVAYTGTGVARTVPHNLGVVPEMMIVKRRSNSRDWAIYHKDIGLTYYLVLNLNYFKVNDPSIWNNTIPSLNVFSVGNSETNNTNDTYIAYLFATLPGISKVGSYTGTGAQLDIDAGFATGPAFLLIKRTDNTGDWYLWDSTRGIVSAGNDPYLLLNSTATEVTNTNYIDPINTGFRLTSTAPAALNASGGTYIYYSVAKP